MKVLVVNDSRFEAIVLKDVLGQMGFAVELSDEYKALGRISKFSPDYFIANYIMKETSGDKLIEQVKQVNPNIKCLLSSSNSLNLQEFKSSSVDGILLTPVSMNSLKKAFDFSSSQSVGE